MNPRNRYPLLFLHGFPFSRTQWLPQIEYFSKGGVVLAPDLRGHGAAPSPKPPWMIAHFASDLREFLDAAQIEKVNLCGLSMGGYIALHFCAEYPDRVSALILCDTRPDADSNEAKDKRYATIERLHREGNQSYAEEFAWAVLSKESVRTNPDLVKRVEAMILENDPGAMSLTLGALASRRDSTPSLAKISCPTLVLVGADDSITPPDVNRRMSELISGAEYELIPGAGHLSNLEQPERFNTRVAQFLNWF